MFGLTHRAMGCQGRGLAVTQGVGEQGTGWGSVCVQCDGQGWVSGAREGGVCSV